MSHPLGPRAYPAGSANAKHACRRDTVQALERALATGSGVTLPGTFLKEFRIPPEFRDMFALRDDAATASVRVFSTPPDRPFPLRYEVERDGRVVASIDHLDFRVKQIGTREMTLTNESQPIAFKAQMVIPRPEGEANYTWRLESRLFTVHLALQAVRFHNAIAGGGIFRTISVETGLIVSEGVAPPSRGAIDPVPDYWTRTLEALDFIQRRINSPIWLPDREITDRETQEILETAEILRIGRLRRRVRDWSITIEKQHVGDFFERFPPAKPAGVAFSQVEERHILGTRIDMGPRIFTCKQAYVSKRETRRITASLQRSEETAGIEIRFRPFKGCVALLEYPKWLPEGDKPAVSFGTEESPRAEPGDGPPH